MENKYPQFDLLEFLEDTGIANERNISDFIIQNFNKPTVRISNEDDKAVQFLQSMSRRELIKYNRGQLENVNNRYVSSSPTPSDLPMWFDEETVMANITLGGLEYLYQHKMNKSIISSNEVISENSKTQTTYIGNQTNILLATALFAVGALCLSGVNLCRDIKKDNLERQIKARDSLIHTLQTEKSQRINDTSRLIETKKTSTKKN